MKNGEPAPGFGMECMCLKSFPVMAVTWRGDVGREMVQIDS